jgi:hypothetical protein
MVKTNEYATSNDKLISLTPKKGGILKKLKSGNLFKLVFPKVATMALNFVRIGPRVILRSTFQLLRTNIWTRLVSTILLVFFDFYSFFKGRISKKQLFIDLILSLSLLVGGTAGWVVGTNGALLIVAENTLLFIIAGLIGAGLFSSFLDRISRWILGFFLSSDVEDMLTVINEEFAQMVEEHDLSYEQACDVAKAIEIDEQICVTCFTKSDRRKYVRKILTPHFLMLKEREQRARRKV